MSKFTSLNSVSLVKIGVTVLWLILLILLLKRDFFITSIDFRETQILEQAAREEFQGIFFRDERIGFVKNSYTPLDSGDLQIEQQAEMRINVLNSVHPISLALTATLNRQEQLKDFILSFKSRLYTMEANGKVTGNRITFTLDTGNNIITDSLELAEPPMLSTSRRAYLLRLGLETGDKIKAPWFDPLTLTPKESVVEYRGIKKILIQGRIHALHHFLETASGTRINFWLNETGDVIKEESPAGFVFLKEPKFKAQDIVSSGTELLSAVAVKVTGTMPSLAGRSSMSYMLSVPEEGQFVLDGGRQSFTDNRLTITREPLTAPAMDGPMSCPDKKDSLLASPYIQADHPDIQALSNTLTDNQQPPLAKVRTLADWVFTNLQKRPVLGIPDALTTLQKKIGDCNEHAVLFAALARAAGIPTTIAAGVIYHKDGFYYHAWNEVCLGTRWVSIDTTTNQFPADLSHIKFIEGEIQEQLKIGALLGQLAIEPLEDSP